MDCPVIFAKVAVSHDLHVVHISIYFHIIYHRVCRSNCNKDQRSRHVWLLLQVIPPVSQRLSQIYIEINGQVPDAQMVGNITENEEPDLPEFIGLGALPPPTAALAAAAAAASVAAEALEEGLQPYEKACSSLTNLFCSVACLAWSATCGPSLA